MLQIVKRTPQPQLHSGDHMNREEFHAIYKQMPEDFKAELIGGIVYVSAAMRRPHANNHVHLTTLFGLYEMRTPGIEAGDNGTLILGDGAQPQPDLYLRILPEFGGQSQTNDDEYVVGAPELIAEVADSSRAIDLHAKLRDYRQHGVREYLVLNLRDRQLHWFDLTADGQLSPDADGVLRLRTMPGLWIHGESLLAKNFEPLLAMFDLGIASEEHRAFVKKLAAHQRQE